VKTDSRALLRDRGLRPKKSFGQNFLVSEHVSKAIAAACVTDDEIGRARVVELGAGLGALTSLLVERAAHVVAIERDRELVPILREALAAPIAEGRLDVVEGDAQTAELASALGDAPPRILCGNLPYQITGQLLRRAVEHAATLERAVFMVQAEVAARLVAAPSTKDYGALTIFVRAAFDVDRVMTVSRGNFHPPPDVTSAVVRLRTLRPPRAAETPTFRALVRGAFEARRKTLRNAWSGVAPAEAIADAARVAGVSLDARGETLDVDAYARVAAALDTR
jgi:16S rRNA (adenine1518-N6/adenine1519-N6)-dimethyltransferase